MIGDGITAVLLVIGGLFMLLASVGLIRMPDLYMRMSAATKAGTLGISCILLAMVVYFGDWSVSIRGLAIIGFSFLTAPVAAHMIARAAYLTGVALWERTIVDELKGRYDLRTHVLSSTAPSPDTRGDEGERF